MTPLLSEWIMEQRGRLHTLGFSWVVAVSSVHCDRYAFSDSLERLGVVILQCVCVCSCGMSCIECFDVVMKL